MNRPKFCNNQIYHIYNRGVDKRNIFIDDKDYLRFIHDLFEFNDTKPAVNFYYKQSYEIRSRNNNKEPRELLVKILAFCLMPNHYHLMIEQLEEGGISEFCRKLGIGYAMYFNQKYQREGSLFQGRFKAVLINQEPHFIHLPYYIHLNPLDLIEPEWRKRKIKNYKNTLKFLKTYRWSSYLDYIGVKNFPSVTQREFLLNFFNGTEEYKKSTMEWLKELDIEKMQEITID